MNTPTDTSPNPSKGCNKKRVRKDKTLATFKTQQRKARRIATHERRAEKHRQKLIAKGCRT